MALPTLTPEQRADALAKAAEARKARSELLASIKSGKESIEKVLKQAKENKTIGKTKVTQLLKAVPGLGAVDGPRHDEVARHLRVGPGVEREDADGQGRTGLGQDAGNRRGEPPGIGLGDGPDRALRKECALGHREEEVASLVAGGEVYRGRRIS